MLLVTDFGSCYDWNISGTLWSILTYSGQVSGNLSKLLVLTYSGQVCMLLLTDFGSCCDPNILGTPGSGYGEFVKTRGFGLFRPVLYAITH